MNQGQTTEGCLIKLGASLPTLDQNYDFSTESDEQLEAQTIEYSLRLTHPEEGDLSSSSPHTRSLNPLVGQSLSISYLRKITCLYCGSKIKKTYSDGYCYPCFIDQPSAAECIIRPALCLAHEGGGRDPEWEGAHHLQPHYVYLALSSKYKVGVTRDWPTRWLDQGADAIKVIAKTPYRQLAGLIEQELSEHYSDKLSWQRMLKDELLNEADLDREALRCAELLSTQLKPYATPRSPTLSLRYPKVESPKKVKSIKLSKLERGETLEGRLIGIKGQYLIFDEGRVFNVRAHSGYHINLSIID